MPVARPRSEDRVDYVIVRRTNAEGKEEVNDLELGLTPTTTVYPIPDSSNFKRQPEVSSFELDLPNAKDVDDEPDRRPMPTPWLITMTIPQAQATGGALQDNDPTETVVVAIAPPPPPGGDGNPNHQKGGISQTTEHLLIAAGSIGATIIIVMILLAIHTMRKRGLTLRDAVQQGKYQVTHRGPRPPPKNGKGNSKQPHNDYGTTQNDSVMPPQRAMSIPRSGSTSSQLPLVGIQRSDSFNTREMAERTASPEAVPQSFLLNSPTSGRSHRRNNSETPSSPVLPLQNQRNSESTHNTRSMSEASELKFPDPPAERALSPLPPPPTFKQFLFNRPSISGRPGFGNMVSRFSWTNSNAPQTPHDPHRDTNSQLGRDSFMTSRSSIPRFRTVDSWVNQQADRITEQKLREQFRMTQTSTVYSGDDDRDAIPEVPQLPQGVTPTRTSTATPKKSPTTPPPPSTSLPGKNVKHQRSETRTTVETAPIFRQHPGTEVRFSTRSAVPSEILDMGRKNTVLS